MPIRIGADSPTLPPELVEKLHRVSFPTLGHYLEEGFAEPGLQRFAGTARVVGRAVTVRTTATDSTMLHHAAGLIRPGDVAVIDTGGDTRHAPLGQVVATALSLRGAAGAIVDGAATDIDEIRALGLPVYARGLSVLTTKLHDIDSGALNVPVTCGGVTVNPGDVVLADSNGVLFASVATLQALIDTALEDDAEEPDLIRELEAGGRLGELTGATAAIERFLSAR
ncbi:RraA family protein [Leifsonia poae]|uniref:RraA family protein n=1 Tax=Leifsonia poae TaxID=110933 RepID=UPI001CC0F2E4|nr:RraA family protein [Leifsonia poae]